MKLFSDHQKTYERSARHNIRKAKASGAGLLLAAIALVQSGCIDDNLEFALVEKGRFRSTLTETGELQAASYTIIPMPRFNWRYGRPKISNLELEGTFVRRGDVVGTIDTLGVVQEIGRMMADLARAQADLKNMDVQHAGRVKQLEGNIRSAESSLRVAEIDEVRVSFESDTQKRLKALDKRIKRLALRRMRRRLETVSVVQAEDLRIHRAKVRKIESEIAVARQTLNAFILRAPDHGLIEYRKNRITGQKVAPGDQLWPGTPIIGLPNLSRMRVATCVSETDIDKIALNQQIRLRLDAYPNNVYAGHVTEIGLISRRRNKADKSKFFNVQVLLNESDPLLRPGMTVSCEFLVEDLDDVLFVPGDCIHRDGGEYVLYVKQGRGLKRVSVSLGPRSSRTVVVSGDVSAGDRVARLIKEDST